MPHMWVYLWYSKKVIHIKLIINKSTCYCMWQCANQFNLFALCKIVLINSLNALKCASEWNNWIIAFFLRFSTHSMNLHWILWTKINFVQSTVFANSFMINGAVPRIKILSWERKQAHLFFLGRPVRSIIECREWGQCCVDYRSSKQTNKYAYPLYRSTYTINKITISHYYAVYSIGRVHYDYHFQSTLSKDAWIVS